MEVSKARNLGRSFMTYNYVCIFPAMPGATPSELEELTLRCHSAGLPGWADSGTFERWYKKVLTAREPGRTVWDDTWECTFREGDRLQVVRRIDTWRRAVADPSTGEGAAETPSEDLVLKLLDEAQATKLTVRLLGAYPITRPRIDLVWEGGAPADVPATFTFVDVEMVWP